MGRADYKKMTRTKYTGQSDKGGRWVEIVATKKEANKKIRKINLDKIKNI